MTRYRCPACGDEFSSDDHDHAGERCVMCDTGIIEAVDPEEDAEVSV